MSLDWPYWFTGTFPLIYPSVALDREYDSRNGISREARFISDFDADMVLHLH